MFRLLFWKLFLPEGWYLIGMNNAHVVPAYWTGFFFETRIERIQDHFVTKVFGRL